MIDTGDQVVILQNILLVIIIVVLPLLLIGAALLFMKGATRLQKAPKSFMFAGFFFGILYAGLFAYGLVEQASIKALAAYGLCALIWPLFGFLQFRARTKAFR